MKKFLSLFLALSMILSLCACSKGGDASSSDGSSSLQQNVVDEVELTSNETEVPKKVTGDRVPLSDEEVQATYMPTDFVVGAVDPEDIFVPERIPLDENNMRMSFGVEMLEGGTFKMSVTSKDDVQVMELETAKDDMHMMTRFFEQDGEAYIYCQGTDGVESGDQLYHVVSEVDESEDGESEVIVEDSDMSLDISTMMDGLVPDSAVSNLKDGNIDSDQFVSCEYVGLIGNNDTFEVVDKEDNEYLLLIDHTTGWLIGINQTNPTEDYSSLSIRIEYSVEDAIEYDVSGAEDIGGFEAIMMIFAQFMMLVEDADLDLTGDSSLVLD